MAKNACPLPEDSVRISDVDHALAEARRREDAVRLSVAITAELAGADPSITIYHVVLENQDDIWEETYGSREQLDAFLRGLRATCSLFGIHLAELEVPRPLHS